jgi:hypothetical protein
LLRSGQIKLRVLDGYRDLKAEEGSVVTSSRRMLARLNFSTT